MNRLDREREREEERMYHRCLSLTKEINERHTAHSTTLTRDFELDPMSASSIRQSRDCRRGEIRDIRLRLIFFATIGTA